MMITMNGEPLDVEGLASTLHDFLVQRGMKLDRVAVERNGEIVPRSMWGDVTLASGDRREVVHFVGGGCPITL